MTTSLLHSSKQAAPTKGGATAIMRGTISECYLCARETEI